MKCGTETKHADQVTKEQGGTGVTKPVQVIKPAQKKEVKIKTRKDLEDSPKYKLHHTSRAQGYVSRKSDYDTLPAEPYKGHFGEGYTVLLPAWDSTLYCWKEYYIKVESDDDE